LMRRRCTAIREDNAGRSGQEGMAILVVLWTIGILALISAVVTTTTRTEINRSRNILESAKAEALADAGVYRAIAELLNADQGKRPLVDGTAYRWTFQGVEILLSVQSEAGKIDLNAASDQLLSGLFGSVGVAPEEAKQLVDAIRDFSDRNSTRRSLGAEDTEYHAAGMPDGAKDSRFQRTSELRQVMGMTPALYNIIAPVVTVYSGAKTIDSDVAPRMALLALPGTTPEKADAILAKRGNSLDHTVSIFDPSEESDLLESEFAMDEDLMADEDTADLESKSRYGVFTVAATVHTASGGNFTRIAVVRLVNNSKNPFIIHEWRQGSPSSQAR
jgi:general secretion pathway protein K